MGVDNFFRQILPNGMTVVFEKRNTPLISVIAAVRFGSGHELAKIKGIAHFIEHAVFKGTKKRTRQQINSDIEKKGGIINAFTDEELTAFWVKTNARYFDTAMDVLSDILLNPTFIKKECDMERKVILEEIKMYHDIPKYYVMERLKELLYAQPFGMSATGTAKTVSKISRSALIKYHSINYAPSNIVISIVGDAEVDKIWNISKKIFSKGQVQRQIDRPAVLAAPGTFDKVIETRKGLDQAHLAIGFYVPTKKDRMRYAAEIFNAALGVGMSSKLNEEIREKQGLAYSIFSTLDQGKDFAYCMVYAGVPKTKVEKTRKMILEEIKKFKNWNQKELDETKEQLVNLREVENENTVRVAENLLREQMVGDAKEFYKYAEHIYSVTLDDIKQIADIKDYAFFALVPETEKKKRADKSEKSEEEKQKDNATETSSVAPAASEQASQPIQPAQQI